MKKKSIMALTASLLLSSSLSPLSLLSVTAKAEIAKTGQIGENVRYVFSSDTGTLTIGGSGDMYDYNCYSTNNKSPFNASEDVKNIVIRDEVTSIGQDAFYGCSNLTSITIPTTVTSIGIRAFEGCSSLTSVVIPYSVTNIGWSAFCDCSSLKSVTMPDTIMTIDSGVFTRCNLLQTAGPIGGGYDYEFGWTNTIPSNAFSGCSSMTSIYLPESITSIGDYAFYECGFESIDIPENVDNIGSTIFFGCSKLKSITLPKAITKLEPYEFEGCGSLETINLHAGVASIDIRAFWGGSVTNVLKDVNVVSDNQMFCSENGILFNKSKTELLFYPHHKNDTKYVIPNSVTKIGDYAFDACTSLTSITIPDGVISIGNWAFGDCCNLTSINIPSSLQSVGDDSLVNCTALDTVTIAVGAEAAAAKMIKSSGKTTGITINYDGDPVALAEVFNTVSLPISGFTIPENKIIGKVTDYAYAKADGEAGAIGFKAELTKIGSRSLTVNSAEWTVIADFTEKVFTVKLPTTITLAEDGSGAIIGIVLDGIYDDIIDNSFASVKLY